MEHFDKIALIKRVKNNDSLLSKLIEIAKEDIPEDIKTLEIQFKNAEYSKMKETAHSIKGTGLNMSFDYLAEIALELEKINETEYNSIPELITSLKNEFALLLKEL
ncbi:MAG: hypothetical protein A2015_00840 [Spirochaetes bacterium GWF1_31_7]|nr:MAG: hypothetical protein A2Y30_12705 [Spirochaetes bacterium GWE1_32_154]OHD51667.1 MAG: hypothetical protein A2Y29_04505 [Spirochaetes bacterium GWE2_31_10]OHD51920.1 MAG: hypothetical protein A2015_00840 [Spirochaetes bacterium GWF1_31_7]OHD75750.1 MAG: hypothetical protein A2355_10715 [Spirochaetes bacterium RIFOXYB1_FULL_32_8]HBD93799.1 hypothetical protein [Spirochaetia bacterium]